VISLTLKFRDTGNNCARMQRDNFDCQINSDLEAVSCNAQNGKKFDVGSQLREKRVVPPFGLNRDILAKLHSLIEVHNTLFVIQRSRRCGLMIANRLYNVEVFVLR
jgi:hypothetical protein